MNAVNLLPPDLRRGSAAQARSGGAVYVVLAVLGVAVVLASVAAVLQHRVADRQETLAQVEADAAVAEQQAAAVSHYKELAAQTGSRVEAVRTVAAARNDWSKALRQVSETVGTKVSFLSLNATATPASAGGGSGSQLRAAIASPAIDVAGCAENHAAVARMMARFRAMNDVKRVSLASSEKGEIATSEGAGSGECPRSLPAQFAVVIFLEGGAAASSTTSASTTTGTETNR